MTYEFHIDKSSLHSFVSSFANKRVLVIGDIVADEYLIGRPTRIAREAPVLILELQEERTIPGGATNVAVNARTLGADVFLAGVIGDDHPGQRLRAAISEFNMHQEGVVIDTCLPLARRLGKMVVVDSHGSLFRFKGVAALTPNQPEAELALGMPITSEAKLNEAGQYLLDGSEARAVLITRGSEGMSLFEV